MDLSPLQREVPHSTQWRRDNLEKARAYDREYMRKLRLQCIAGYGGACACCGDRREYFLTFDHVENDGAEHRRQLYPPSGRRGGAYRTFLRWMVNEGFPPAIQLLCANCQMAKVRWGECPCQREEDGPDGSITAAARRSGVAQGAP